MKCLIIETDGKRRIESLDTLESLQAVVGGYIEGFDLAENANCYINEEGKIDNLPINELATRLCHERQAIMPNDFIVGPMIVYGPVDEETGEGMDIPDCLAVELMKEPC